MQKDIHPNYDETTVSCACGNVMHIRSTGKLMTVNVCSKCHPFYTGKSTLLDSEGRVQQFNRRYKRESA